MKKQYEQDETAFPADAYAVRGHRGIAWHVLGWETEPGQTEWYDEDVKEWVYDEEPEPVKTGNVVAVMVGDDRHWSFEPEDLTALDELAYCAECGQIGCTHDGRDRS